MSHTYEHQQLEWQRQQGLLEGHRDVMDPRSPIQGSLDPAQMAGNIQDYFAPGGQSQARPGGDVGDYRQSAQTRTRNDSRIRFREMGINPDTGELINQDDDDGQGMWANMFGGSKAAGRAMQTGAGIGGGVGSLVGGLVSMFSGQPTAMLEAYKRLQEAMRNLEDPQIQRKLWNSPVFQQIAQYTPELLRDLSERVEDMETYEEGDAALRQEEDLALARLSDRARRGDPLAQRIATQKAQSQVSRAVGRGAQTASELAARRGMPGAPGQGLGQAQADVASQIGQQNLLMARGDMVGAERAALAGASSIRQSRESATARAMNIRNNFRNAMSNRQLAINMGNQQSRQAADDRNQTMAQRLHESNLSRDDQRRIQNQERRNRWETEEHDRDLARIQREGQIDIEIGRQEDAADRAQTQGLTSALTGVGRLGGMFAGAGFFPGE